MSLFLENGWYFSYLDGGGFLRGGSANRHRGAKTRTHQNKESSLAEAHSVCGGDRGDWHRAGGDLTVRPQRELVEDG